LTVSMPKCPYCGLELPGLQTLCRECYASRQLELDLPQSARRTLFKFLSNPLNITDRDIEEANKAPAGVLFIFWCCGLSLCWFGGWARAHYESPLFSAAVLHGALICLAVSLPLSLVLARKNLRLHLKVASLVFVLISMGVAGHFYLGSMGVSRLIKVFER